MSISSEITSMGENLKKDYQSIANLGADLTNVDKNIENISSLLDGVYDVLPKTEFQEGTEVTIEGGLKGKLDFDTQDGKKVVGYGDTEQDGEPTPSTPVAVECVTGNQEIVVSGKQLIPFPYSDSDAQDRNGVNWSVNENGTINANGTANASSSIFYLANGDNDIYLEPGTYKISTNLFTDANGFSIQAISIVNGSYGTVYWNDMVLTERTRLRVRIIAKPNATVNVQNAYLMIERGNTATTYEPYITPTSYQLSLGDIQLCGIGDYKDELIYDVENDRVYKNEKIGKVVLKTLDWETASVGTNSYGTRILMSSIGKVVTDINIISSHAKGIMFNDRNTYSGTSIYDETNGYVVFRNTSFTSLEDFTTFLNNNNVYAYYVLATAQKQEITTTLKDQIKALYYSHSLNGTTIITSNGDLPLVIKCRGLKGE